MGIEKHTSSSHKGIATTTSSSAIALSDAEFAQFQGLLYKLAGIYLAPSKKVLLVSRLNKRLKSLGLATFREYYQFVTNGRNPQEQQTMVDLLTTNETYFFREPRHFDFLIEEFLPARPPGATLSVWSAACSTGEEPYSLAMVLADKLGKSNWRITASDISTQVLEKARQGHYSLERSRGITEQMLRRYCLKGVRAQDGTFLIADELRNRVDFMQINLIETIPRIGPFDLIFLRNVMIYFDQETKRKVINNMLPHLKPGGYFIIGHSETLNGITDQLKVLRPTIYVKS